MCKFADIVFSPHDEESTGKGWYVQEDDDTSDLFETEEEARIWAADKGYNILSVFVSQY